jgi:hypothetical protein
LNSPDYNAFWGDGRQPPIEADNRRFSSQFSEQEKPFSRSGLCNPPRSVTVSGLEGAKFRISAHALIPSSALRIVP